MNADTISTDAVYTFNTDSTLVMPTSKVTVMSVVQLCDSRGKILVDVNAEVDFEKIPPEYHLIVANMLLHSSTRMVVRHVQEPVPVVVPRPVRPTLWSMIKDYFS